MNRFFNPDNIFLNFMGRVADLIILNLLFVLCCFPVVTAGSSLAALYYMTLKMIRNEETYIIKGFFHSFRQNLRQGIVIHLIMLFFGGILIFDLTFFRSTSGSPSGLHRILSCMFWISIIIYFVIWIYVYPLLAKFFNPVKEIFKNAFFISIHFFPYTLIMLAVSIAPIILMLISQNLFTIIIFLYPLFGFSVTALINSYFLIKIFDKCISDTGIHE